MQDQEVFLLSINKNHHYVTFPRSPYPDGRPTAGMSSLSEYILKIQTGEMLKTATD